LVDSKVVNTSKKVSPIEPLKEKYFKIKSSNESFRNLDVGKSSTLSEIDWFDNEDKILTNHQTPKNPQQIKKSLENQEFELFTKPKPSKVTIVNKEHLPSGLLAAGSKITYRADLKPKLFQSKGNGVLTSAELPKQITSKSKGLDSLKKSPSISNLGSRGSLNLKEMMNSKPNKYLLESLQGSSTNLLNYSKLSTPKDSKIPTESVPSRAFPLIRTNSKGSISKDNSPDTSRNLASKFPKHLNPINSPTFKQKKLFELNETSKKSYSRPSVLKDESSSSAFVKNSVKDDDFKAAHSIRDPSESQDNFFAKETTAKESLSALRRKGESNFSLRNFEDKHYFLAQSAVQSRRTSKPTALPVLGSHAINTKSPVMTTAKKNGPAFSSLNSSKVHPFRLSSEKSLVISPTINPEGKKDFGQSPSGKKNALSRPWLNKVMSFLKWTEDQNSSFNLETQERLNNIAGSLLAEAKEQYLMMKLKQSEDSKDTLDTTTQVNSYTKGTLSYLKLRYKKEEESNKVIIEALTDELERLVQIKDSMDDPG
jgi:hypothetical protein